MSTSTSPKVRKLRRRLAEKIKETFDEDTKEELLAEVLETPKIIKRYPKQKCVHDGCRFNAVGAGDTCVKHGGNTIIQENLLAPSDMTSSMIRATKYKPEYHPLEFIMLSKEGMSTVEIAAEFEVSPSTIKNWSETYLEFNNAYDIGVAMHEAWWLKEGKGNLDNRSYNVGLFKFLTSNKLGYSDKMESKSLNIHAGVLMVPGQPSLQEWEAQNGGSTDKTKQDS